MARWASWTSRCRSTRGRLWLCKLAAFVFSSAQIALQGAVAAHLFGFVNSATYTLAIAVSYLAMVLIGGPDSQLGSVLGAVVVIWLPYLAGDLLDVLGISSANAPQLSQVVYGILIVVAVTYSSGGLVQWAGQLWRFLVTRLGRGRKEPVADPPAREPLVAHGRPPSS